MSLMILSFPLLLPLYFALIIWLLQMSGLKSMHIMQAYSAVFYALLLLIFIGLLAFLHDVQLLPAKSPQADPWLVMAVGLLALLSGYGLFKAENWLISRLTSAKAKAHPSVRQQASHWWMVPVTVLIVVIEELIWRLYLPVAIREQWSIGWLAAAAVAAIAFGLHHLFYGWIHVVLKSGYGFIWLLLYQLSNSILVPVLSHLVFNLAVYFCRVQSDELSSSPVKKAV